VVVVGAVQFSTVWVPQEVTVLTEGVQATAAPVFTEKALPAAATTIVEEQAEPTAAPTATAEVHPTAVPTPVPTPIVTRPKLGFAAGQNAGTAWPSDPGSTAWLSGDGYHLFAREAQKFVAIGVLSDQLRDVAVSATFHKTSGPPGGGYGIILRDQGPGARDGLNQAGRYYVLEVGDRGETGIWRREQSSWVDVQPWSASPAVRVGSAENELVVKAVGDQLTLRVNGVEVASKRDAELGAGGVGVFLGGDQNQAVLTQLTVEQAN
jgi:hypothetical protein